jgi:hypothetical protein
MRFADSANEVRLMIKMYERGRQGQADGGSGLSYDQSSGGSHTRR